jgi:signal transduction histidine kinase
MTKILVIEDEEPLLEEIQDMLGFEDFETIGAENGLIGVQLAQSHLPDLIISDIMMPELDGYSVLLELQSDPRTASIPFIFLTAKADRSDMRQGMTLGADDFLTKPFTNADLLAAVYARLKKRSTMEEQYEQRLDELHQAVVHFLPHELRNPLHVILGYADLIIMDQGTLQAERITKMAEAILRSGKRLERLFENYLLYAQLEVLRAHPGRATGLREARTANSGDIVAYVARDKAIVAGREADLKVETTNIAVPIAEDNLKKMAEELIDNAFKFSAQGTRVHVTAVFNKAQFALCVGDNGRGMTADQIKGVGMHVQFERQLYEQQGSGLGLVIAKYLAELHAGQMTIESVPDRGTRVCIEIPLAGTSTV